VTLQATVRSEASRPRVSVIIPCRNEESFIRATLESILRGTFDPEAIEVLVIDGDSSDATREIVSQLASTDARVRLLDNPRGLTPIALNIGIRAARGDIIVRVDAHSSYPPEYVATLVHALEATGADMVGGCVENVPSDDRLITHAIALATGSAFGTGSRFRYQKRSGSVDAVQLGCWRREVFDRIGMFDERLIRNQDNEHSSRIIRAGGRVYMTSEVSVRYHPRSSLRKLWKQASVTGMWNAFTEHLFPYTFRWRHFLPAVFFLGIVAALTSCALAVVIDARWFAATAILAIPYAVVNLAVSTWLGVRHRRLSLVPAIALVFFLYHFSYGFGITKGWIFVLTGSWKDRLGGAPREARLS